jgi:NDP-sugar pyrophosphorylase family protein
VNNVALLDRAVARVRGAADRVAVNAHHHAPMIVEHLAGSGVHVSVEDGPAALGTAGAIGHLAGWLAGAPVLIHNADAFHDRDPLPDLIDGWGGVRPRLLVVPAGSDGDFGPWRFAGASLLSGEAAAALPSEPAGLYEVVWRQAWEAGDLELVPFDGVFYDCGTPADYLRANLWASGGVTVVGQGAVVDGEAVRCVVWPGARVEAGEHLVECIRAPGPITVDARLDR